MKQGWLVGVVVSALAACSTPPPKSWLRLEPSGAHDWTMTPEGKWATRMHGADFAMDLNRKETRIEVVVNNRTAEPMEVRIGPEGTVTMNAIGEVLLRQIDAPPGQAGPDMLTYANMQRMKVEAGWRGTFYIDSPLGREIGVGTYFVFTVEAFNRNGDVERRRMPMLATNAGTAPTDAP